MEVAIVHPYAWPEVRRGAERITVETAAALARRGHQVRVLTAGSGAARVRDPEGYEVVRLRRRRSDPSAHERWFARRVLLHLIRHRYDVVHALMPRDALAAVRARRWRGHRVVYEELGNPLAGWWATQGDRSVRERVVREVDEYGCMSRFALGVLEADHGRRGVLIPGGVSLDEMVPASERTPKPTVLFSGTLDEPRKGVALLLEAVDRLAEHEPDLELWLSGPGDAVRHISQAPTGARSRTVALGLGEPREQASRYARAWVTALPSTGDSFGLALLESLACGTPIVVLDDSAPPELVTPETGVIAARPDPEVLARALADGLQLAQRASTAARCREHARAYSWDALAERLERIYAGG